MNGSGDACSGTVKPWPRPSAARWSGAEVVGLQPQHLDRLAGHQVLVEDRRHVRLGYAAVPDVVGHHQQARSRQAALHAAGGHHLHVLHQPAALLLAQLVEHFGGPPVQARPLRMARRALVGADEDVLIWLAHGKVPSMAGCVQATAPAGLAAAEPAGTAAGVPAALYSRLTGSPYSSTASGTAQFVCAAAQARRLLPSTNAWLRTTASSRAAAFSWKVGYASLPKALARGRCAAESSRPTSLTAGAPIASSAMSSRASTVGCPTESVRRTRGGRGSRCAATPRAGLRSGGSADWQQHLLGEGAKVAGGQVDDHREREPQGHGHDRERQQPGQQWGGTGRASGSPRADQAVRHPGESRRGPRTWGPAATNGRQPATPSAPSTTPTLAGRRAPSAPGRGRARHRPGTAAGA